MVFPGSLKTSYEEPAVTNNKQKDSKEMQINVKRVVFHVNRGSPGGCEFDFGLHTVGGFLYSVAHVPPHNTASKGIPQCFSGHWQDGSYDNKVREVVCDAKRGSRRCLKICQIYVKRARCVLDHTFCSQSATHKKPSRVTQKLTCYLLPSFRLCLTGMETAAGLGRDY
jgi:hypothetical protein